MGTNMGGAAKYWGGNCKRVKMWSFWFLEKSCYSPLCQVWKPNLIKQSFHPRLKMTIRSIWVTMHTAFKGEMKDIFKWTIQVMILSQV